jgi:phospholipase C
VLKLIEWRWGLPPLTARDASPQIGNFATEMNFANPDTALPTLPAVQRVVAAPCPEGLGGILSAGMASQPSPWARLARR